MPVMDGLSLRVNTGKWAPAKTRALLQLCM